MKFMVWGVNEIITFDVYLRQVLKHTACKPEK